MRLDGKMEVVMVNRYTKFQLNVFNSNEVIQVCKNFNLVLQRQRRRTSDRISSHFLRKVELKKAISTALACKI